MWLSSEQNTDRVKRCSFLLEGLLRVLPHLAHPHSHLLLLYLSLINGFLFEYEAHDATQTKQQEHVV